MGANKIKISWTKTKGLFCNSLIVRCEQCNKRLYFYPIIAMDITIEEVNGDVQIEEKTKTVCAKCWSASFHEGIAHSGNISVGGLS